MKAIKKRIIPILATLAAPITLAQVVSCGSEEKDSNNSPGFTQAVGFPLERNEDKYIDIDATLSISLGSFVYEDLMSQIVDNTHELRNSVTTLLQKFDQSMDEYKRLKNSGDGSNSGHWANLAKQQLYDLYSEMSEIRINVVELISKTDLGESTHRIEAMYNYDYFNHFDPTRNEEETKRVRNHILDFLDNAIQSIYSADVIYNLLQTTTYQRMMSSERPDHTILGVTFYPGLTTEGSASITPDKSDSSRFLSYSLPLHPTKGQVENYINSVNHAKSMGYVTDTKSDKEIFHFIFK